MRRCPLLLGILLLGMASHTLAQPRTTDPGFGMEFEFAGAGNRIPLFENMPFENYKAIMRQIVRYYGGRVSDIKKVEFQKPTTNLEKFPEGVRTLFRAEWKDPRGRTWRIEPEFVATSGFDGYELVTPPMDDTNELREILRRVQESGLVRTGRRSGVHLTIDGSKLIKRNGDARALVNLMMLHENNAPTLRRLFNPVRGGGHANYFARNLSVDHHEMMREIAALPESRRTRQNLERIFAAREGREARLHGADPMDPNSWTKLWKYRDMNLAKILGVNELHDARTKVVEFRMFDLADAETHKLQADLYRRMVAEARAMADRGETVEYTRPRRLMSEDPAVVDTAKNPEEAKAQARRMIESFGLDPAQYETLIERNVQPRSLYTEREFRGVLDRLPTGRVEHNGKAFTYGFELEGRGAGFVNIAVPTDAAARRRWSRMSEAQKRAYFEEVTGGDAKKVDRHFRPDTERFPWIDPDWKVEKTGNWEIRSTVYEDLSKAANDMRRVSGLTGESVKGFHLHMRDNAPNWESLELKGSEFADWMSRSGDWVYLKRVERLRTDLSLKSWSNARMAPHDVNLAAELAPTLHSAVRISHMESGGQNDFIDLEIRGLSKYVDDIERLARVYTEGLRTERFGPWRHTDNLMETDAAGYVPEGMEFRTHVGEHVRNILGTEMSPERIAILDGLNKDWVKKSGKDIRAYPTGVATPLYPWANEGALTEVERYKVRFAREEFVNWLTNYTDRIQNGEFGTSLSLASKERLVELGLSPAEAEALISYRRGNGGAELKAGEAARAVGLRAGTNASMAKLAKLDGLDLGTATSDNLRNRLGLTAAEAKTVIELRQAHTVEDALRQAGLNANAVKALQERASLLDLGDSRLTAKQLQERTGVDAATAERILAYRRAHDVTNAEGLKAAGLTAAEAKAVLESVRAGVDTTRMRSPARIAEAYGITQAEAQELLEVSKARKLTRWNDLLEAGLTPSARDRVKEAVGTLKALNELPVEEIARRARLTDGQWDRLADYRDASDPRSLETLTWLLGKAKGEAAWLKVNGLDLSKTTFEGLRAAGIKEDVARRIVNHRDAHDLGRGGGLRSFDAELAANELARAGIIPKSSAWNFAVDLEPVELEWAEMEDLRSERLGLTKAQAERFVMLLGENAVNLEGLKRAGFTDAKARKVLELAKSLDPKTATVEAIMKRTGVTRAQAGRLKALARVDFARASVETLVEAGISADRAERLVEFRETAKAEATGIEYADVVRNLRLKVRKWVRESGLSDALLRSMIPKIDPSDVTVTRQVRGEGEAFSSVRRAKAGEFVPSRMTYETVGSVFASVRQGGIERLAMRMDAATTDSERANLRTAKGTVERLQLEIVETNDILADRNNNKVRVSTGLLNEIATRAEALPAGERAQFRNRLLGLVFGHETAHAGGLRSEKLADIESIRILESSEGLGRVLGVRVPVTEAEVRQAVLAFEKPLGDVHTDSFLQRLRQRFRYGSTGRRINDLERATRGEQVDRLAQYRRADGTLDWKKLGKSTALREGLGTAHFALALFLKELAVVVQTGDRARIEEFFDGLMTTDFYTHYGMFVIGARAGEVAYVRYLERYIKPRFVNGILKTNLVLAAGLALPEIVGGTFTGRAFAISLTSLGLSSAAVKSGVRGIKWVIDLKKAKNTGTLARTGLAAGRLAKFGGWFYTAAELAVILYIAEDVDIAINRWVDRREARKALSEASRTFFDAVGDPGATPESVAEAASTYHDAWTDFRDFLYTPLHMEEAIFADRLEKVARQAKQMADRREQTMARLERFPSLRRNIESRHGTLENYADSLLEKDDKELSEEVEMYAASYNTNRDRLLEEVYGSNERGGDLLEGVDDLDWLLLGGRAGAVDDPYPNNVFGNLGRSRARASLDGAIEDVSLNRLETYGDERRVLEATMGALRRAGHGDLADAIDETNQLATALADADEQLYKGDGTIVTTPADASITSELEEASEQP